MKAIGLFLNDVVATIQAVYYNTIGNTARERAALERVIAVRSQYMSPSHGSVGEAKTDLASTYLFRDTPDHQKAEVLLSEAQESIATTYGANSGRMARVIHMRARIQLQLGNLQDSLKMSERAEAIYSETHPVSYQRVQNLRDIADLHRKLGDETAAANSNQRAEELSIVIARIPARYRC